MGIYYFPKDANTYEYLVRNSIYPSFSTVDELRKAVEEQLEADINAIGIALRRSPELAAKFGEYFFQSGSSRGSGKFTGGTGGLSAAAG